MPPARKRAAKKVAAPEFSEAVTAVEYTEDDNWDGSPEEVTAVSDTPKQTRTVSPLVSATRTFEKAHKLADKARAAYEKVRALAEAKEAAEQAEQEAYDALQTELSKLGG